MKNIKSFEDFIYESLINEGDINYKTDQFALVLVGGSIGRKVTYPVFVGHQYASISETGNDKEALVEKKKRMNKLLSPGEKKYYGMSYKVIELTNARRKDVDDAIALQNKSDSSGEIIDESNSVPLTPKEQEKVKDGAVERLYQFFRVPAKDLMKFKFDGTDSIKDLTKALNSTSDEGTKSYYNTAIKAAKKDLGLD